MLEDHQICWPEAQLGASSDVILPGNGTPEWDDDPTPTRLDRPGPDGLSALDE